MSLAWSSAHPSPGGGHDIALNELFSSVGQSVPVFLDQVFGFLAYHKPDALLTTTDISLEHLVSQAVSKWRCKLSQQRSAGTQQEVWSRADSGLAHTVPGPSLASRSQDTNFIRPSRVGEMTAVTEEVVVETTPLPSVTGDVVTPQPSPLSSSTPASAGDTDDILYCWSQTMEDVDVRLPLPSDISKGKQVDVRIQSSSVSVTLKDDQRTSLLTGLWHRPVNANESLWDMAPGKHLTLHLSKLEASWWGGEEAVRGVKGVVEGSTQSERNYNSLPSEEQADIRKIIFDAEQKAAGKPTSDALKMESMLRDAWNADGSPFKGQPFDLSNVNLAPPEHFS